MKAFPEGPRNQHAANVSALETSNTKTLNGPYFFQLPGLQSHTKGPVVFSLHHCILLRIFEDAFMICVGYDLEKRNQRFTVWD